MNTRLLSQLVLVRCRPLFVVLLLCCLASLSSVVVQAENSLRAYAERLTQAEEMTSQLTKGEPTALEVIHTLNAVKRLLPEQEDVETNGRVLHVNNAWLHQAIDGVIKISNGDVEQRRALIQEIADRLYLLEERINPPQPAAAPQTQTDQQRLERILARPDYLPDEKRESALQKWVKRAREKLNQWLSKLFGSRRESAAAPSTKTAAGFRILLTLLTLTLLIFGLVALWRRFRFRRRQQPDEDDVREVLGEELAPDITATDLLSQASALARQGDFRTAIRRSYIALLCEMEQRGKLRLHRSKTNRDYLDALRPEQQIYPTFSAMTGAFEHIWYGQEEASADAYQDFMTLYQETTKG